jgi:hypothetical protein
LIAVTFTELYDEAERRRITEYVCSQVAEKRPLYKVFAEDGEREKLCSLAQFNRWLVNFPDEVRDKVAQARELAFEAHIEEMIEIADDKQSDPDPSSRKVRIYAREKAAAMIAPRRFGQKLDVTSDGKALPAPQTNVTMVSDNRVQTLIALAAQRKEEKAKLLDD